MEEDDKGCPMIRMGVSGWMFLLVPAYPGSPGQKAVKRLCVCVCVTCFLLSAFSDCLGCSCVFFCRSCQNLHSWLRWARVETRSWQYTVPSHQQMSIPLQLSTNQEILMVGRCAVLHQLCSVVSLLLWACVYTVSQKNKTPNFCP